MAITPLEVLVVVVVTDDDEPVGRVWGFFAPFCFPPGLDRSVRSVEQAGSVGDLPQSQ